jgi:hypothetical protein
MATKVRSQTASYGQVWVYVPNELDEEQREMMGRVIRERDEKLTRELDGVDYDPAQGDEDIEGLPVDELYGRFLEAFFQLSEGDTKPEDLEQ